MLVQLFLIKLNELFDHNIDLWSSSIIKLVVVSGLVEKNKLKYKSINSKNLFEGIMKKIFLHITRGIVVIGLLFCANNFLAQHKDFKMKEQNTLQNYDYLDTTTDIVTLTVQSNSVLSNYNSGVTPGEGFRFQDNPNALFTGGIIMGNSQKLTVGMVESLLSAGIMDMVKIETMPQLTSNDKFNEISIAKYIDALAPSRYGVEVEQKTYAKIGDPYIYVVYNVKNTSNINIEDFYIGMFLDWDIGNLRKNAGGYEAELNLIYQFDVDLVDPNFYGVIALDGMSGARVSGIGDRELIVEYMSTFLNETISNMLDYRSFIGSGPYNISPGSFQLVGFAIVAGTNLSNIKENAEIALEEWNSGIVSVEEKEVKLEFTLSQNYPNPFNPTTVIEYTIPNVDALRATSQMQNVTLKVFDLLGREVETLVNENKEPGKYQVQFNASNLSSGLYFYKIQAGNFNQVRKMIFLK